MTDTAHNGYCRSFGHTDDDLARAQDNAHNKASEYDGHKAFHVIELPPFIYKTSEGDPGGVIYVVDSEWLEWQQEQPGGERVNVITTCGIDPDDPDLQSPGQDRLPGVEVINVSELAKDDEILNVGKVKKTFVNGVFKTVVLTVTEWSTASGKAYIHDAEKTFHLSEELYVKRGKYGKRAQDQN